MNEMEDFPYEFTKPFLLCFNLLKRCNIGFFDSNVPVFKKYWRSFFIIPFVLIHYISVSVYMSRVFTSEVKISELAFMVPVFLILTQGFLKAAVIIPRKADTAKLIKELGSMWRTENLNNYQIKKKNRFLKQLNLGHTVFYWGSMIASWQNLFAPLAITLFRNFLHEDDTEFLLPIGCVYPFDPVKNWMRYIAMYAFQLYTTFRFIYVYIGTEFVMITLCAHLTTEFALLREDLKQIKPRKNKIKPKNEMINSDDNSGNSLKNIIRNHQKLIQLTCSLNNIFSVLVFIDLLFATVIICFFGFGATVAHGAVDIANNFIAVLALLLPIYILCYHAELLKLESSGIAESAYDNVWYNYGTHYQSAIRFIILRLTCSLNNIFSVLVFIDLLFATVIICFFGFGATVAHGAVDIANNFIAVLALLLPIYILCYHAELLKLESSGIAESAYDNVWYNYGTHYQSAIRFIILRSQRHCCLTSLNYVPITLNTFTKVVSTTWSYFSLARSLYSND